MEANCLRVLLVEDSPSDHFLIREHLNEPDLTFEITRAKSLASALRKLPADRFDCVLLDLNLPDAEGVEVIRAITEAADEAAVVVLTGNCDNQLALRAIRYGAQDYLLKDDISLQTLSRTVRFAVQRKRIQQKIESSERRLALAIRATHDAIWDWDVRRDSLYLSPSWFRMLGLTPTPFLSSLEEWLDRVHPDDRSAFRDQLQSSVVGDGGVCAAGYRLRDSVDQYRRMFARWCVVVRHGELCRCVGTQIDVERSWKVGG